VKVVEIAGPLVSLGLAAKLVQRTVGGQLGGSIAYKWLKGLIVKLRMF